jgi:phosphatidylglycerophosphate synthase
MPLTIANVITLSRLAATIVALAATVRGDTRLFVSAFAYALVSDVVDGRLARALDQDTAAGARLDSLADCVLYLSAPIAACLLFPWMRERLGAVIVAIYAAYLLPIGYGYVKYRRLTAYHTAGARIAAISLSVAFFLLLVVRAAWPLVVAASVLWISALDEIAITWLSSDWRPNIRSAWHAARLQNTRRPFSREASCANSS